MGPLDRITPSNENHHNLSFGLSYELNNRHSVRLTYSKILNFNTIEFYNPGGLAFELSVFVNSLVYNGELLTPLNEDGTDRLDRLTLDYNYSLYKRGILELKPSLGVEVIHSQEEFYYMDYFLFTGTPQGEFPSQVGSIEGQYHQRLTPFIRPGISIELEPEKSFLSLWFGAYYRFPILWNLNDIYVTNMSPFLSGIDFEYWRTAHNNSGRTLSLEFGAQLSLTKLRRLF